MDLTDTQLAILALIAERLEAEGMPPSQAEIAKAFGFKGVRAAQYHLEALEQAGAIERVPGRARGIRLLKTPPSPQPDLAFPAANEEGLRVPVLGQVAAGAPIGADADHHDYVLLDRAFFAPAPDYLLKVRGDSMRDEGIFDGDVILVDRAIKPRHGHIVVAVVDGAFTCKKLWLRVGKLKLLSANPEFPDIIPQEGQTIEVWGVVLASVKRFQN